LTTAITTASTTHFDSGRLRPQIRLDETGAGFSSSVPGFCTVTSEAGVVMAAPAAGLWWCGLGEMSTSSSSSLGAPVLPIEAVEAVRGREPAPELGRDWRATRER
jgi:hypothetical protein